MVSTAVADFCARCERPLGNVSYHVRSRDEVSVRCLRCALQHRSMVMRSLRIALVVGVILVAINQGNFILAGDASLALAWKVPLTFAVPYCVSTLGAMLNARMKERAT